MDVILSLMKKRILLCVTRDQFEPFDYSSNATGAIISMGLNSGNGVFQFALQKMLLHPEVSLDIDTSFHNDADEFLGKADFINANYDAAITSVANGLAVWAKESGHLRRWAKCVGRIKIPFTFVGLGAQSDTAYGMDFADEIRDEAKEFLGAIIKTGGAIGLRGDFTAKVAKHLGFSGDMLQTVGCPSLFMNGGDLKVDEKKVPAAKLKVVINGIRYLNEPHLEHLFGDKSKFTKNFAAKIPAAAARLIPPGIVRPQAVFICQDMCYRYLYDTEELMKEAPKIGNPELFMRLYAKRLIRLFGSYPDWRRFLEDGGFNFSMGSKIHGNICSILSGIPAHVDIIDSRTRELSEFFEIPHGPVGTDSVWSIYRKTDYSEFNKNFSKKYAFFKKFMNTHGFPVNEDPEYQAGILGKLRYGDPVQRNSLENVKKALGI